jgi:RNA polymerase sigma factor (TIGR02999 family)
MPSPHEVTQLLLAWNQGDPSAFDKLMPLVYTELHRLAKRYMQRQAPGNILQTTALIHEAYVRLIDANQVQWQNRAHFFAVSAQLMRRILVDEARSGRYQKRGGGAHQVSLAEALEVNGEAGADIIALDEALKTLAAMDERKSQIVEMRFFGGLSVEETAEVLKLSPETVMRDWKKAKLWLMQELKK